MKSFLLFILLTNSLEANDLARISSKESALLIGEALLQAVYGKDVLRQRPFKINETKATWILDGTFHCPKGQHCLGGVAHLEFSKADGRIIKVNHGK